METRNAKKVMAEAEKISRKMETLRYQAIETIREYLEGTTKKSIHLYDFEGWSTSDEVMEDLFEVVEMTCYDEDGEYLSPLEGLRLEEDGEVIALCGEGDTIGSEEWEYKDAISALEWLIAYSEIAEKRSKN